MDKESRSFLNQVTSLPAGHPVTLASLKGLGVSEDLAGYYARTGWLARIAQGLYVRPGPLDLHASLKILELRLPGCHVGGRTALTWLFVRSRPLSPSDGIPHTCQTGSPNRFRRSIAENGFSKRHRRHSLVSFLPGTVRWYAKLVCCSG